MILKVWQGKNMNIYDLNEKMLENQYIEYISTKNFVGRKKQSPIHYEPGFADEMSVIEINTNWRESFPIMRIPFGN